MKKHLLYAFGAAAVMAAGAYTVAEETGMPEESNATISIFSNPEDGSTVKAISTINLIIPSTGETLCSPVIQTFRDNLDQGGRRTCERC